MQVRMLLALRLVQAIHDGIVLDDLQVAALLFVVEAGNGERGREEKEEESEERKTASEAAPDSADFHAIRFVEVGPGSVDDLDVVEFGA